MDTNVKSGGTWRTIKEIWVKSGGTWRDIQEVWVKSGGSWRQVFQRLALALPTSISSSGFDASSPYNARAAVKVDTDGYMYRLVSNSFSQVSGSQYWISDKTATMSNYECKMEGTGDTPNDYGLNLSTWYTLSADRTWGLIRTVAGSEQFNGTLYIREIADTGNQVTCSISLDVEAGLL
jgi:hypothetical protein